MHCHCLNLVKERKDFRSFNYVPLINLISIVWWQQENWYTGPKWVYQHFLCSITLQREGATHYLLLATLTIENDYRAYCTGPCHFIWKNKQQLWFMTKIFWSHLKQYPNWKLRFKCEHFVFLRCTYIIICVKVRSTQIHYAQMWT